MSFEEFVDRQLTPLLRYATVLCADSHLAQDVVQEVLVRAQGKWQRIGAVDNPYAYVKRMVTNEYLSWRRRRDRRVVAVSYEALGEGGPAADPMAAYDLRDAMLGAIARLPRKQRAAVVLRYYDRCPDQEIAEILGCGVGTVRSHISRALGTLRTAGEAAESLAGRRS